VVSRHWYWIHPEKGLSLGLLRNGENHPPMALPYLLDRWHIVTVKRKNGAL
jgi:hypothetical protein